MEILVFKTNIRHRKHVNEINSHITNYPGILKWNVDLKDVDKVLRIETVDLHPSKIENLVRGAGYNCEGLRD